MNIFTIAVSIAIISIASLNQTAEATKHIKVNIRNQSDKAIYLEQLKPGKTTWEQVITVNSNSDHSVDINSNNHQYRLSYGDNVKNSNGTPKISNEFLGSYIVGTPITTWTALQINGEYHFSSTMT